jgi:mRNA-degrading endonuclease RelE of RelBE toxin-antitoxin system
MNLLIEEAAVKDIRDIPDRDKEWIMEKLEELKKRPIKHENTALIKVRGVEVFRFKMKEEKRGDRDYRAIFDINGNKIKVNAIFHRDQGYNKEELSYRL